MKYSVPSPKLRLAKYLAAVPAPPSKVYWEYKVPLNLWGMFANDTIGDCTCACIAHMLMLFTAHTGTMVTPTVDQIVAAYSAITGYIPGDPSTDNGAVITDVLNYWRDTGIAGHKILGWAAVNQANIQEIEQAIWLFGGVDVGITVYQSMEDQFAAHQPWDHPSGNVLGGHSIPVFGYGSEGCTGVTWAMLQQMGWSDFEQICQEAYVVITQDWLDAAGKAPNGFDLATLQADLAAM